MLNGAGTRTRPPAALPAVAGTVADAAAPQEVHEPGLGGGRATRLPAACCPPPPPPPPPADAAPGWLADAVRKR